DSGRASGVPELAHDTARSATAIPDVSLSMGPIWHRKCFFRQRQNGTWDGVMGRAAYVVLSISLAACASSSATSSESLALKASPARNVITATEIVASRVSDVYQAVTQLRPDFLRRRSSSATLTPMKATAVTVYLDELPYGGVESLSSIPLERVRVI